jgi:hypothetical protein
MAVALRTSLIWHDEVMKDLVAEAPTKITLGRAGNSTFVVPDLGLPKNFAIVRPGNRGYLLTLGERMKGTICIDGRQQNVEEFVRRNDKVGGFCATPISGRDWGVIDLDEDGTCKLFFQFVPIEEKRTFWTPAMIAMAVVGWTILSAAFTAINFFDFLLDGHPIDEALFRGIGFTTLLFTIGGLVAWLIRQDPESQASLAFSIILHGVLLWGMYIVYDGIDPFAYPGERGMPGSYNIARINMQEQEKLTPTVGKVNKQEAAAASPTKQNLKTATKNDQGASGGKGDTERARDPNAKDVPPDPPKVGAMTDKNRKVLDNVIERNLSTTLGNYTGIKGDTRKSGSIGFGPGTGTGVGEGTGTGTTRGSKGKGTGGGGNVEGDFVTNKGKIDTGTERPGGTCVGPNCKGAGPREVKVAIAEASGDFGGLTREEIDRVVKARAGVFRACYQKELNRTPGIGGKMIIRFVIGGDGVVKNASNAGGSFTNDGVGTCVKSNIMRLKFPAKGGANVTYPFLFTQGG